jgi:type VI secretion system secreted protein VgrG
MPLDQSKRQIGIETPLGANVLVLRNFIAREELGRLFQIDAELLSENFQISFPAIVGQNVTIRLNTIQNAPRFFNGHVRAFRQSGAVGRLARYQAVIVPKLWFLTRSADCRIFQHKKVPDIVKEVLQERGITEIEDTLGGTYPEWEYCVQYRETDFNFISRLMEQEGIYYYFKHAQGNHKLVLADADSGHPTFPGYADMSFLQAGTEIVNIQGFRDLTMAQEVQPGRYVLNDYDFEKPKASLKATANIDRQNVEAKHEMYDYPGEYIKLEDGERDARTRIEEVQSAFETAYGSGDVRGVAPGFKFKLSGAPRSDQNDNYLVVSTIIQAESEGFLSDGGPEGAAAFGCSFSAVRATTRFRPERVTRKPIIQGAQTAVVTGPKGEEIHTDKFGRIKVQFHWDRKGKKDENTTCFIRVAEPWAGKRWGSIFTPRIGQEVVVNFLEGDPDQPLIIGSVYNGEQMPPYELPAKKTQSGVKTRSTLNGTPANFNEIRFEDKKGQEQLYIHAEKNEDIVVENNKTENVGNDESIQIGHDRTEKVGHDQSITVLNDDTLTVAMNQHLTIGINQDETIGQGRTTTIGVNDTLSVGAARTTNIGAADSLNVGGAISITAGGVITITAAAAITITSSATVAITAPAILLNGRPVAPVPTPI